MIRIILPILLVIFISAPVFAENYESANQFATEEGDKTREILRNSDKLDQNDYNDLQTEIENKERIQRDRERKYEDKYGRHGRGGEQ